MKIAMFTNTFLPHVGGVARSVDTYATMYEKLGHECLIVAPEFEEAYEDAHHVVRVPALKNFNDSGFSIRLPSIGLISEALDAFEPDIVHSHHPFLLGDAALRAAYARNLPLIFTHHTLYEQYTNYLPIEGDFARRAAIALATAYANSCDLVFAPSQSLVDIIRERGVETAALVQPTGIDVEAFAKGDGPTFRRERGISQRAFVIGHVGRLATEKNLDLLMDGCLRALAKEPAMRLVMVGNGDRREAAESAARDAGLSDRVVFTGPLQGESLAAAYASFDVFAFTSQSETQGLVLVEAMASGTPVVALDGPGVRDVVTDGSNGYLLPGDASAEEFASKLLAIRKAGNERRSMRLRAAKLAREYEHMKLARQAVQRYADLIAAEKQREEKGSKRDTIDSVLQSLEGEFELLKAKFAAVASAVGLGEETVSAPE